MTLLAPTLEAFFTQRLISQRQASPHTVAAYRDTFRLLLHYAQETTGKAPARLQLADLDASVIGAFLDHLEHQRGASASTRNARLAAVRSLFRFAAFSHPDHASLIQRVLAIPNKRGHRVLVTFLTRPEMEAILGSPDRTKWTGRRDHALLLIAMQTGLRVSELVALRRQDVQLATGAYVYCHGKGRKDRCTPLTTQSVAILRGWLQELGGGPADPLFPGPSGAPLGRDAVRRLLAKYAAAAAHHCPSLIAKRVSPHVLRHTSAMQLLQAGIDTSVIALWLGHETTRTTQIYLHADLALKERAIARIAPPDTPPGRYRPPDTLLAFLDGL
jgi:integrase/recombinase XerD